MTIRTMVHANVYFDSVELMRVAQRLESEPDVETAAAIMGTPANRSLLSSLGLETPEAAAARPDDLVIVVKAASEKAADRALELARTLLESDDRRRVDASNPPAVAEPKTLAQALELHPQANVALIAVPGPFAYHESRIALERGLHVLIFSDHVSIDDEVALKRLGVRQGRLVMGPECGTALIDGIGLGFCNVVRSGRIGIVGASGTGIQQVMTLLDRAGEGISQAIGVGGRDLSAEVQGLGTGTALERLDRDPGTEVIIVIGKSPDPRAITALQSDFSKLTKPTVLCFLGEEPAASVGRTVSVTTLEGAARAAIRLARGEPLGYPDQAEEPGLIQSLAERAVRRLARGQIEVVGLYSGGSLCAEALGLLRRQLGDVKSNLDGTAIGTEEIGHRLLDLGAEEFTRGRPHPMIDPSLRIGMLADVARDPSVAVVLLDVILGLGAHPDPAGVLSPAITAARASANQVDRNLVVIATVCGTPNDPQGFDQQMNKLVEAGAVVVTTNAAAARLAGRIAELAGGIAA